MRLIKYLYKYLIITCYNFYLLINFQDKRMIMIFSSFFYINNKYVQYLKKMKVHNFF